MATAMVTQPMDLFFQPLFYTFEGLLDDIRDRLESPNKLLGTWGSKKGPAATECMKGLGHLKVALELRPALYAAERWSVFGEQMKLKESFDKVAAALLAMLNNVSDIVTPTMVGDSPSVQVYFVRNVLAFLAAMESFPSCQRPVAERVANFFTNSPAKIAEYRAALQSYLNKYNMRHNEFTTSYIATLSGTRTEMATAMKAAATETAKTMPLPPGFSAATASDPSKIEAAKATLAALAEKDRTAAIKRYGLPITTKGGRRHTKRNPRRRNRKSRRHQ